jgi:hypothetical protein
MTMSVFDNFSERSDKSITKILTAIWINLSTISRALLEMSLEGIQLCERRRYGVVYTFTSSKCMDDNFIISDKLKNTKYLSRGKNAGTEEIVVDVSKRFLSELQLATHEGKRC